MAKIVGQIGPMRRLRSCFVSIGASLVAVFGGSSGCVFKLDSSAVHSTSGSARTNVGRQSSATETSRGQDSDSSSSGKEIETGPIPGSILDRVHRDPNLSRLKKAIVFAQMEAEFHAAEPRTLFAPTNQAFNNLSAAKSQALFSDPALMRKVLGHHLVAGRYERDALKPSYVSLFGAPILISVSPSGGAVISGAERDSGGELVRSNIAANNGLVHQLDEMLWIPEKSIFERIKGTPKFSALFKVMASSDGAELMKRTGSMVLFAPNNKAFVDLAERMGQSKFDELMKDSVALTSLLKAHVHPALRSIEEIGLEDELQSLQPRSPLRFEHTLSPFLRRTLNGRKFDVTQEIFATNGLIIEVDATLHDG